MPIQRRIIHSGTPTISPAGIVDGRGASPGRTSTASTAIRVEVVGTSALLPVRFRQVVSRRRALRVDARGRIDRLVADGAECLSRNMRATVTRFHVVASHSRSRPLGYIEPMCFDRDDIVRLPDSPSINQKL